MTSEVVVFPEGIRLSVTVGVRDAHLERESRLRPTSFGERNRRWIRWKRIRIRHWKHEAVYLGVFGSETKGRKVSGKF